MTDLDPDLADAIAAIEREGLPPWHSLSVDSARRVEDEAFAASDPPAVGGVRAVAVDGPGGDLPLRIYRPPADAGGGDGSDDGPAGTDPAPAPDPRPVLVFYHGGGWVLGTLDSADGICRRLARRAGSVVVSVDYRLAPEHPFPAAVDDAVAAYRWAREHAASVGGDPDRVGVAGTSAGAALATGVARRARDAARTDGPVAPDGDLPAPTVQVLAYPMVGRAFDAASFREHADDPLLSLASVRWFWNHYLDSPTDAANPYAVPLSAPDQSALPPAVVATAGHDVLRSEGRAYADALADAGVPVEREHFPALCHGFLSFAADVPAADAAFDAVVAALERARG